MELPDAFSKIGKSIGANCGVIVLKSFQEDNFEEYASFGYEEEGFYYIFMSRNQGHFDKVAKSQLPLILHAKENRMYYDFTDYAIVSRIYYNQKMYGFVLFEFTGEYKDIYSLFTGLFADRISRIYGMNLNGIYLSESDFKSESLEILSKQIVDLPKKIDSIEKTHLLLILGSTGCGKKFIAKSIHKKNQHWGDIIIVNSIPEQFVKIEKSLLDWETMIGEGVIVFDNISSYKLGQQRVMFEYIVNQPKPKLFFVYNTQIEIEKYKPFWIKLEENKIDVPDFNQLDSDIQINIIHQIFNELTQKHGRPGLVIDDRAVQKLLNYQYKENVLELKNVLEYTIIKNKKDNILEEDLVMNEKSVQTSFNYEDMEDLNLRRCVDALERQKILLANKLFSGNQVRMAKALGISRGSLQYKMKQMEL